MSDLIHPDRMGYLGNIFNSHCAILHKQIVQDPFSGEEQIAFISDNQLNHLRAYVDENSGTEVRRADQTIVEQSFRIALNGYYPTISVDDRAVIDGEKKHNILNVIHSDTKGQTVLVTEIINNPGDTSES